MKTLDIPTVIERAMKQGATLAISISGGKDSQALIKTLATVRRKKNWPGTCFAIHAHLGRAEWAESLGHCHLISQQEGIPLIVVKRKKGDLVDRMKERMQQLAGTGKPFWPSAKVRYCTSHLKTRPIDKFLRKTPDIVISAEGIRAKESRGRAKKSAISVRKAITAKSLQSLSPNHALSSRQPNQRLGLTWYPLFDWSTEDVWQACDTSGQELLRRQALFAQDSEELKRQALDGWPCHPAYVYGNERVSCAICILGSRND